MENSERLRKIIPNGDILPTRCKYSPGSNDWQIGVNYLYADDNSGADQGIWVSFPDVGASIVLTGKCPKIIDAFRIEASGKLPGLNPVRLRGEIPVDPSKEDFFRVMIQERKRLGSRGLPEQESDRLDKALKVLANSTSYGIYAEMNPRETEHKVLVKCHGIDKTPYECWVQNPEQPGPHCFPPLAALITGGARLKLALLEHSVTELGGTYAMEDTDSMAIVATKKGEMVPCPGGPRKTKDGRPAIKALSWKQVEQIVKKFDSLNPYQRDAVPGSVLKIEDVNFDPHTKKQRQVYCFAISAKRYAHFVFNDAGEPELLRKDINNKKDNGWKEHGLGHLLNPLDPDDEKRDWIGEVWLSMIRKSARAVFIRADVREATCNRAHHREQPFCHETVC